MKFNISKFERGTNYSCAYENWSNELLSVLEESGDKYTEYENGCYKFLKSVRKEGKYKRMKLYYIVCPCDSSDITVEFPEKMNMEEIKKAIEFVINFIAIMTKHGYITD